MEFHRVVMTEGDRCAVRIADSRAGGAGSGVATRHGAAVAFFRGLKSTATVLDRSRGQASSGKKEREHVAGLLAKLSHNNAGERSR